MLGHSGEIAHLHRGFKRALRCHRPLLLHQLQGATLRRTLPRDPTANGITIHIRTLASYGCPTPSGYALGQFVVAEGGGGGAGPGSVNANRNAVGPWETFVITLQ